MRGRWIDVREYAEYAAGHIEGSELFPLAGVVEASRGWDKSEPLTVICKSGRRAAMAAEQLSGSGFVEVTVLEGGIDRWREEGKPLRSVAKRPWALERQVRVVAGLLVLLSLGLAFGVSRYFFGLTAFVGAGLVFAGVSDICMMATALGWMPWNRAPSN